MRIGSIDIEMFAPCGMNCTVAISIVIRGKYRSLAVDVCKKTKVNQCIAENAG